MKREYIGTVGTVERKFNFNVFTNDPMISPKPNMNLPKGQAVPFLNYYNFGGRFSTLSLESTNTNTTLNFNPAQLKLIKQDSGRQPIFVLRNLLLNMAAKTLTDVDNKIMTYPADLFASANMIGSVTDTDDSEPCALLQDTTNLKSLQVICFRGSSLVASKPFAIPAEIPPQTSFSKVRRSDKSFSIFLTIQKGRTVDGTIRDEM